MLKSQDGYLSVTKQKLAGLKTVGLVGFLHILRVVFFIFLGPQFFFPNTYVSSCVRTKKLHKVKFKNLYIPFLNLIMNFKQELSPSRASKPFLHSTQLPILSYQIAM